MTGSGTPSDPYKIYNVNDLQAINNDLDAYYELANDIDASATATWNGGLGFEPIGSVLFPFTGTLDGKGYKISYLYINRPTVAVCIFYASVTGTIKNLKLLGIDYTGKRASGIADDVTDGQIENCEVSGTINAVAGAVSGIADSNAGVVTRCTVRGTLTGTWYASGICDSNDGLIEHCVVEAAVICSSGDASGICDSNDDTGVISHCQAKGDVTGFRYASGCCDSQDGLIEFSSASGHVTSIQKDASGFCDSHYGTIKQCFATGPVTAARDGSGFCYDCYGIIEDSYSRGSVTAVRNAGGFVHNLYGNYGVTGWGTGILRRCYSTGYILGHGNVAGFLVFDNDQGSVITDCFWDIETSGQATSNGGTGKTTKEMKTLKTFSDSGWDIDKSRAKLNNGYPFLSWQLGSSPVWLIYSRKCHHPTIPTEPNRGKVVASL
jgi:hypothetical protein